MTQKRKRTETHDILEEKDMKLTFDGSSFGIMRRAMQKLGMQLGDTSLTVANFTRPRVVVIGRECVGKSSLIEQILMSQIFPRGEEGPTTRCPVEVLMTTARDIKVICTDHNKQVTIFETSEKILGWVTQEMSLLSTNDKISPIPLIIDIYHPDLPTIEFVDLPGLVAYPDKLRQDLEELCLSYVKQKDSMVVLVEEAVVGRLTSSRPLSILSGLGRLDSTVLVLTKLDLVHPDDIDFKIKQRMNPESPELMGLSGKVETIVGLINRTHRKDALTLSENKKMGENWKKKYSSQLGNCCEKVGLEAILGALNAKYSRFIVDNWVPRACGIIDDRLTACRSELTALGPFPVTVEVIQTHLEKNGFFTDFPIFNNPDFVGEYVKPNEVEQFTQYFFNHNYFVLSAAVQKHLATVFTKESSFKMTRFDNLLQWIKLQFVFPTKEQRIQLTNYILMYCPCTTTGSICKYMDYWVRSLCVCPWVHEISTTLVQDILIEDIHTTLTRQKLDREVRCLGNARESVTGVNKV